MATFLAIDRSNPVGIIACYRDEKQPLTFHVIAMWVAPEARGNGIGRRLLRTVEDWIVAAGGTYVQLSVADRAEAARRLYQTSGYLPHGASADSPHTPGVKHVGLGKNLPRIMRDSRQTAG